MLQMEKSTPTQNSRSAIYNKLTTIPVPNDRYECREIAKTTDETQNILPHDSRGGKRKSHSWVNPEWLLYFQKLDIGYQ